jgi:N-acetylglucosamine kinase-like BadF-type ATPase
MPFYLGIDAGGTKTLALIVDEAGQVLGAGRAGSGNWESVGLEGALEAYAQALGDALSAAGLHVGDLAAAGYTLAGFDWPSDEGRLAPVVARLGVPGPYILMNDTAAALRAGTIDGVGVAVICGTGSTVAGCNRRGESFRTFGLGMLWGDYPGASGLVAAALGALGRAHFGSGPSTALEPAILAWYRAASVAELAEWASRGVITAPDAQLAPLVVEVAAQGDAVALEIVRAAGEQMGQNAAAVARRLELADEPFALVLAGGVFRSGSPALLAALETPVRAYAPRSHTVLLDVPPAIGSALLALDAAGVTLTPDARARLNAAAVAYA